MNTKYTPTPYSFSGITGDNHLMADSGMGGKVTVAILVGHPGMTDSELDANKEFFVTACNHHDELVAALEQSEQAMAQLLAASVLAPRVVRSRPSFEHGENLTDSALANARSILAKLKG